MIKPSFPFRVFRVFRGSFRLLFLRSLLFDPIPWEGRARAPGHPAPPTLTLASKTKRPKNHVNCLLPRLWERAGVRASVLDARRQHPPNIYAYNFPCLPSIPWFTLLAVRNRLLPAGLFNGFEFGLNGTKVDRSRIVFHGRFLNDYFLLKMPGRIRRTHARLGARHYVHLEDIAAG